MVTAGIRVYNSTGRSGYRRRAARGRKNARRVAISLRTLQTAGEYARRTKLRTRRQRQRRLRDDDDDG